MASEILLLPVQKILKLYKEKQLSPVDVTNDVFEQIEMLNPALNAFVVIKNKESLLQEAKASEQRWMNGERQGCLDGIPVTIKDGGDNIGWPTRDGSLTTSDKIATSDSPPSARLREAGAIFIGKTTTPEFGHKGVTDSSLNGITRNPWDNTKTSGGSSGGAAVAAATGMGYLHIGTDGGGSIRIPSSFCGVFGFKPTRGLVPHYPPGPFSLSTAGPITRTVEDAALMLDVITRPDSRDGNALPYKPRNFAENLTKTPKSLRIAYTTTINNTPIQPETARFVAEAAKKLENIGNVEAITLEIPRLVETFNTQWMGIASWIKDNITPDEHDKMDLNLLKWAERGHNMSLNDYINAALERSVITNQLHLLLNEYDILVMPTMAITAFDVGHDMPYDTQGNPWEDWTPLTFPANLAKLPAASLPCGVTKAGLPVGIQIISGFLKDNLVMNTAYALEQQLNFKDWLEQNTKNEQTTVKASAK